MTINFDSIGTSHRPRREAEIHYDMPAGGSQTGLRNIYVMGERIAAGTSSDNEVRTVPFADAEEAEDWFGEKSFGAWLVRQVMRGGGLKSHVYGVAVAEGSAAAAQTVTFANNAGSDGTITLNIGGSTVSVDVESGDMPNEIGAALVTALGNLSNDLRPPADAVNLTGVVTVTAWSKGLIGNDLPIYQIITGDEPSTTTVTVGGTTFAAGAGDPTITTALANMAAIRTPIILCPWNTTPDGSTKNADLVREHLKAKCLTDAQQWGVAVFGVMDTVANLVSWEAAIDSDDAERCRIIGLPYDTSSSSPPAWSAAAAAYACHELAAEADIAAPLNNHKLPYIPAPNDMGDVLTTTEVDTLLEAAVSPVTYDSKRGYTVLIKGVGARLFNGVPQAWAIVDVIDYFRYVADNYLNAAFPSGTKLAEDGETNLDENTTTPSGVLDVLHEAFFGPEMKGKLRNRETLWASAVAEINASQDSRVDYELDAAVMMGLDVIAGKIRQRGGIIGN